MRKGALGLALLTALVAAASPLASGAAQASAATKAALVKDINPGAGGSGPYLLTNVNRTLFFRALGESGSELWKSKGTAAGTTLVKDIYPGPLGSDRTDYPFLIDVNGTLFFNAYDDASGIELWKSDGTVAGTTLVKDIQPGPYGSEAAESPISVNGTLFFTADDGANGDELWRSDGTAAGTTLVKDINPGAGGSGPYGLTNLNGTVFFSADDGTNGYELWKSDGTAAGTTLVKDVNPGIYYSFPSGLTNVEGTLFFHADDGTNGRELWKSDGTEAATTLVKDIKPGAADSIGAFGGYSDLTNVNGTVFFSADDGTSGGELGKSDGTAAGTALVKDTNPGAGGSFPGELTNINGTLFFSADDGTHGVELWKTKPRIRMQKPPIH
jgi:ELWxxDGT repeat protein